MAEASTIYTVGGTVQAGRGIYLTRQADDELLALCRASTYAYILTARQMGKSSLMVRTSKILAETARPPKEPVVRTAFVDLGVLGAQQISAEEWYFGLVAEIADQLALDVDLDAFWQEPANLGLTQRLTRFFTHVLLSQVNERVVVFIDEIDNTLNLDFTDDFFVALRHLYVARAQQPALARLSFVLCGSATPSDLIADPQRTPFNIGWRVELDDFTATEARPLVAGFTALDEPERHTVLERVLAWTHGHPYLTQRLCAELARQPDPDTSEHGITRTVERLFFVQGGNQDHNLQFVRDMLTRRAPRDIDVVSLYGRVWRGRPPVLDQEQSLAMAHLKLSGAVRVGPSGHVRVRNAIYRRVFDRRWINQHMPASELRRQMRRLAGVIAVLLAGLTVVGILARYALDQAEEARVARDLAEQRLAEVRKARAGEREAIKLLVGGELVAQADRMRIAQPNRLAVSTLLAIEAAGLGSREQSLDDVVHHALPLLRRPIARFEHRDATTAVAFSPTSPVLATGSKDDTVRIWQMESGQVLAELQHMGPVRIVAFSPDGTRLATASEANDEAHVWRADTGRLLVHLPHPGTIRALAFSPDGNRLATASEDYEARVWHAATGELVARLEHEDDVNAVAFSPDGRRLATASNDGTARVWMTDTRKLIMRLKHEEEGGDEDKDKVIVNVNAVAFSPDGTRLASATENGNALVWQDTTPRRMKPGHQGPIRALAFSPDGIFLATASDDNTACVWDVATGERRARLEHQGTVLAVVFSPDGTLLATASDDSTARLWRADGSALLAQLAHQGAVHAIAFNSPDGTVVATASDDNTARVWQVDRDERHVRLEHQRVVTVVAFSPNGERLTTASDDDVARVWRVDTRELVTQLDQGRILAMASGPDGARVATVRKDNTVAVWHTLTGDLVAVLDQRARSMIHYPAHDASTRQPSPAAASLDAPSIRKNSSGLDSLLPTRLVELARYRVVNQASSTAAKHCADGTQVATFSRNTRATFSPDGTRVATTGKSDTAVVVWHALTGEYLKCVDHEDEVVSMAFSPDSTLLATASEEGTVRVRQADTGEMVTQLDDLGRIYALAFSVDGERLITAGRDTTALVWQVDDGRILHRLEHMGPILAAAFSPDGSRLATASGDATARIWDASKGYLLARYVHENRVRAVVFSPDGTRLATASADKTARIWPGNPPDPIDRLCELLPFNLSRKDWDRYLPDREYQATCKNLPVPSKQ